MSTYWSKKSALSTVYPVVAVTVEKHHVGVAVVLAIAVEVMELHPCSGREEQPTVCALAFLGLEHAGGPGMDARMMAQAACPVGPVPVKRARCGSNLDMPLDEHTVMVLQG